MVMLNPVESTMLTAAGYDEKESKLVVVFNNGKAYEYYDVPPEVYQGLMEAESKGGYMQANVIGVYDYSTVNTYNLTGE